MGEPNPARGSRTREPERSVLTRYEALERECTGGYACFAVEHIEGCHTGEGDPMALRGLYVADLRRQLAGAVSLLDDLADVLAELARGEIKPTDSRVEDVLLRAVEHVNGGGRR